MSGKSRRHGRGKRITQSRKVMQRAAGVASPEVVTPTPGAAAGGGMITSVAPARRQTQAGTALYPFVAVELRLIGILAIIILVILLVLTLVLS